ncbi:MAG: hypothetical protein IPO59_11405 [Betaproteobacteria bacterium]|nr:hypothetical protein [Betaproteobacteria bacterium]
MEAQTVTAARLEGRQLQALLTAVEAQMVDFNDRDALSQAHLLMTLVIPLADRVVQALPD